MSGYFDTDRASAEMLGNTLGRNSGREEGRALGKASGRRQGYEEGFSDGHVEGWNEAVDEAQKAINEQMAYTRQHLADKEKLMKIVDEQKKTIEELTTRLAELEKKNSNLAASNQDLKEIAENLLKANNRLKIELEEMDQKYQKRTKEYEAQLEKHNRNLVFMNTVKSVLEDLTNKQGTQAKQVRELFSEKYRQTVEKAMKAGAIKSPLEKDIDFSTTLPKTNAFILKMLDNVSKQNEADENESELSHI